jgi:YidC/Oxa1 family membrane protein insertase
MMSFFDSFVYNPLYNILIFLYNTIPGQDFGIAIIITTLLLKFALVPLSQQQIESQKKMQELQPQIKALQHKYKDNKEKQNLALMEFYKEQKVNPVAGCLPLIIQLTFLIAIYRVLINISEAGLSVQKEHLYAFVQAPETIHHLFLGIVNLSHPSYFFAITAAAAQYYQTKMMIVRQPKPEAKKDGEAPDFAQIMMQQMLIIGPLLTLFIGFTFPAGLSLYWLVSTLFMVVQQEFIFRKANPVKH